VAVGFSYVTDKSVSAWNTVVAFYPGVFQSILFIFSISVGKVAIVELIS
jgi:hypothetical protein